MMDLCAALGGLPHDIKISAADERFAHEPRGRFSSQNGIVAAPKTTDGVAAVMALAHAEAIPVVPFGGGTGLVGGQIAQTQQPHIILSLQRMTDVISIDPKNATLTAQAGVRLADAQAAADQVGMLLPLTIASGFDARIGGVLATNAGGVNVLRYGNARAMCLGLEVVLADGRIWNGLSALRKDNTGYDLKNLMIGSEGTLGIITAASLSLAPAPTRFETAMVQVNSPAAALDLLHAARTHFGDTISAFELIHENGLRFLQQHLPQVRQAFDDIPQWSVLIDIGRHGAPAENELEGFLAHMFESGLVVDARLAQSQNQRDEFWTIRESIPLGNRAVGAVSSHDMSVKTSDIPDFIVAGMDAIEQIGPFRINCFGHVGDGNLHFNVFPDPGKTREDYAHMRDDIKTTVHDTVHRFGGSVAAEHGVGRLKVADLQKYNDPVKMDMMQAIKTALDPKGILNPGVILPASK
ncbi:MAG: FAD-binding oxidoreductase [Planktomarina sp.]